MCQRNSQSAFPVAYLTLPFEILELAIDAAGLKEGQKSGNYALARNEREETS